MRGTIMTAKSTTKKIATKAGVVVAIPVVAPVYYSMLLWQTRKSAMN